jgi:CHAT domain-containing protein/tetratricopeptide (TPR) repeat protein
VALASALFLAAAIPTAKTLVPPPAAAPTPPSSNPRDLLNDARYTEAAALGRTLLRQAEARFGPVSLVAAETIDLIVESERLDGMVKDPRTRALARRSISIRERLLGPDHPDTARSVNNLANLLAESGEYVDAKPLYERVLRTQEKKLGPDDLSLARTYNNVANLISDMGDYTGSGPMYERALAIKEKKLGPDDPQLLSTLIGLAILRRLTGDYLDARRLCERALRIAETKLRPGHPRGAIVLSTLASVDSELGDDAEARALLERALAIQERELPEEHADRAATLADLADLRKEAGENEAARALYARALEIQQQTLEAESAYVAPIRLSLGEVLRSLGQAVEARAEFEHALRIEEAQLGPDHPDVALALDEIAGLEEGAGRLEEARTLLAQGLRIRKAALGGDHPLVARSLARIAAILARMGSGTEAFAAARRAESIGQRSLQVIASGSAEREALRYAATRPAGLDLEIDLALRHPSPDAIRAAWDDLVRGRALVLDAMALRQKRAAGSGAAEVRDRWRDLRAVREQEAALWVRGLEDQDPGSYRRLLDETRRHEEILERSLADAPGSAAGAGDAGSRRGAGSPGGSFWRERPGLNEVLGALPPRSALVAFTMYRPLASDTPAGGARYAVFIASSAAAPRLADLGPVRDIDAAVERWRGAIDAGMPASTTAARRRETADRRLGEELRRAIWDPLLIGTDTERVFIVPEGSLHLVNFAALPSGDGSGYLIETAPLLHALSAEGDVVDVAGVPAAADWGSRGLLALGDAWFGEPAPDAPAADGSAATAPGAAGGCRSLVSMRFQALPGSRREVEEIGAVWSRARHGTSAPLRILEGSDAGKTQLETLAPGFGVVHVATHGFFLEDCAPVPGGRDGARGAAGATLNPLLLSGLALAGANHGVDGLLTARELAVLDLSRVDWVVMSACNTGVGQVHPGEGVLGLRRAVSIAGARTLIMSLWRTEEEATRKWMTRLYAARLSGASTAESVRSASLAILRERRAAGRDTSPLAWGAFVATGDWR